VLCCAAAVLFHSIQPNGAFEKRSMHGSCPVIKGEQMWHSNSLATVTQVTIILPPE